MKGKLLQMKMKTEQILFSIEPTIFFWGGGYRLANDTTMLVQKALLLKCVENGFTKVVH